MEENKIEVIVVGAGPAGVSAAITLAKAGKKVLLVERGDNSGDKNMFGGCIYAKQTADIFPKFWETAPIERSVSTQKIFLLTDCNSTVIENYNSSKASYKAFTVNRAKWDRWCVEQAEKEGVYYAPKTCVRELIIEDGKILGIKTDNDSIKANIIILADGVNSLLAKQAGLRNELNDTDVTVNVKEVIKLPVQVIEDRFNIAPDEGCACKILGGPLKNSFALGFMYTNLDTVTIGFGIGLDELKQRKITPYELLDELKSHPAVNKFIKDGEVIEYSAHMIPEGGLNSIPKVYDNRVMVVGDAAMMVNNIHMEGTNLAMLSGKLAAETAIFALEKGDFSASTLALYYKKLKNSIIIKDMSTHKNTIPFVKKHIKTITDLYPNLAEEFFDVLTTADEIPKRAKYRRFLSSVLRKGVIQKSIPLGMFAMERCIKK